MFYLIMTSDVIRKRLQKTNGIDSQRPTPPGGITLNNKVVNLKNTGLKVALNTKQSKFK